jgi:uncharacterized membrane protein
MLTFEYRVQDFANVSKTRKLWASVIFFVYGRCFENPEVVAFNNFLRKLSNGTDVHSPEFETSGEEIYWSRRNENKQKHLDDGNKIIISFQTASNQGKVNL